MLSMAIAEGFITSFIVDWVEHPTIMLWMIIAILFGLILLIEDKYKNTIVVVVTSCIIHYHAKKSPGRAFANVSGFFTIFYDKIVHNLCL